MVAFLGFLKRFVGFFLFIALIKIDNLGILETILCFLRWF